MAKVQSPPSTKYHPTKRRELVAVADVRLLQAQVINDKGAIKNVVIWQCGEDGVFAENITDLGNAEKTFAIPQWLKDQLKALPLQRQLTWDGRPKSALPYAENALASKAPEVAAPRLTGDVTGDDDLAGFQSA